jgi:hypothetical protein
MADWNAFHSNPRISYYLYLRQVTRLPAREAYDRLKRADALVVGLQRAGPAPILTPPRDLLAALGRSLRAMLAALRKRASRSATSAESGRPQRTL